MLSLVLSNSCANSIMRVATPMPGFFSATYLTLCLMPPAHAKWTSVQRGAQTVAFQSYFESWLDTGWVGNLCQCFTAPLIRRLPNFQPGSRLLQFRSVPFYDSVHALGDCFYISEGYDVSFPLLFCKLNDHSSFNLSL